MSGHQKHHHILGKSLLVSHEKMVEFVREVNPNAEKIEEIAKKFLEIGDLYDVRGDIAFCQSVLETGYFTFKDSAVEPGQHNYGGLGVVNRGVKGHEFPTVSVGIAAQIQHLYAYATKHPLPHDAKIIDPRFKFVDRGSAPHWEDLNNRWAMNDHYGETIMNIYARLITK